MAGGIDWFRWHHGSVTDPKFQLVARKSAQALASVIAVWAFVLEQASASEHRGSFGDIDCEAIDCLLGLDEGASASILAAMSERGLVEDGYVCAWEKRQVKRERDTDNSADRTRAYRERQKQQEEASKSHVTPRDDKERQKNAREEERREEEKREKKEIQAQAPLPDWLPMDSWNGYAEMRERIRKPMTARAQQLVLKLLDGMRAKGLDVAQALDNSTRNSWIDVYEPKEKAATDLALKRGSDEYAALHKSAAWWQEAGFESVWAAIAERCWHDNFQDFRDGKRVKAVAA